MERPQIEIDINADVGEGMGNESRLLPFLSSCNIACGGHYGNRKSMREVVKLAIDNNLKIGAHPSFPDKENFGRKIMHIPDADLYDSLKGQINNLMEILEKERGILHHVKPHGALYNLVAKDEKAAKVVVSVLKDIDASLVLYAPFGSVISKIAENENLPVVYEAFADRNYNPDLSLVSRNLEEAIITDSEKMVNHVLNMVLNKKVKTVNGVELPLIASTFCIHGDNPKAVDLVKNLRSRISSYGVKIL